MSQWYNIVVGVSLAVLLAMMLGLLARATWRQLKRQFSRGGLVVFLACAGIATVEAQKTKYVDAHATGANTGEDWENAYTNLQTAVRALTGIDDAGEIFVKPGTYVRSSLMPIGSNTRCFWIRTRQSSAWKVPKKRSLTAVG